MNTRLTNKEIEANLAFAFRHIERANDEDKADFTGNEYLQHMVQLSIATSLLVIADNLTAIRYNDNSLELTRIVDNLNDIYNSIEGVRERLP